ncbi:hypothetical protein KP509_39G035300 [Ceratopteris richardii]|uniref:DUF4005 domain-containing protein n=1 Tax=Ceratopteris richardii TaxID=49495 RepID=A0A8T2PZW4_CERRI|nr:hypothetical protein KP509_39G035300 [Ceratopteris richardii]KAH7277121.1 hypothetical protein KP509_39G035300 [Ceratopteris richardii]KAH7277122.1 hypothetical protein KP509_39G035300 [Ceratopteris richardii]
MGKKNNWLSAVRKAFSSVSKDSTRQDQHGETDYKYLFLKDGKRENIAAQEKKSFKERNRWSFRRSSRSLQHTDDHLHLRGSNEIEIYDGLHSRDAHTSDLTFRATDRSLEKTYSQGQNQNKQALAVAVATAAAAEAAVAAAQAAAQVVKLTGNNRSGRNSNVATPQAPKSTQRNLQELAAIRIQTAFRAYLARRKLRTLKGLARLQAMAQGQGQRQTTAAMRCMQALVRAQAAVRGRRAIHLCEDTDVVSITSNLLHPTWENCGTRRSAAALTDIVVKEDLTGRQREQGWDDSTQTIEQIQARELSRREAAIKRERAMAYAFSHQHLHTSNGNRNKESVTTQLGWNWLERWIAARPWDNRRPSPAKETPTYPSTSSLAQRQPSPLRRVSAPATPAPLSLRYPTTPITRSPACNTASVTPRVTSFSAPSAVRPVSNAVPVSSRAHSHASSSMRDDLSVASFSGTPSYMATTESTRAKLRSNSTPKQRLGGGTRSSASSVQSEFMSTREYHPAPRKRLSFNNVDGGSARSLLSWRGSTSSAYRNSIFERHNSNSKLRS